MRPMEEIQAMNRHNTKTDPLKPSVGVLVKLGSIAVHVDEMLGPTGHAFDREALGTLLRDDEVKDWIASMDKLGFMPKKRT